MARVSTQIFQQWHKDPVNFASIIVLFVIAIGNALATQIPSLNAWFIQNNIYQTSTWVFVFFILYQLVKISLKQEEDTKKDYNLYHSYHLHDVLLKYKTTDEVRIFCGSNGRMIWDKISDLKSLKFKKVLLYFKPSNISDFTEPRFKYDTLEVKYSEVPSNYLFVTGYSEDGDCYLCDLITSNNSKAGYTILDLSNSVNHRGVFIDLFNSLAKNNSVSLNEYLVISIFDFITKRHLNDTDSLIRQRKISLKSRVDFFDLATRLVRKSKNSLYAVDFIKPKYWISDNSANKYGAAHAVDVESKKRIHIYNLEEAKTSQSTYMKYIEMMESYGVELKFLDENNFDTSIYEKRGTLMIDTNCVIVAINPTEGATFGEVDFNPSTVDSYMRRFKDIDSIALTRDQFIETIGEE